MKNEKRKSGFNRLLKSYKVGAKKRNLEFNLTEEEFKKLTTLNCYYCGETPKQVSRYGKNKKGEEWSKYIYNGIDRKNNTKGYIINNCVSCCKICNERKRAMKYGDFLNWIIKIYNNKIKDNRKYETNTLIKSLNEIIKF